MSARCCWYAIGFALPPGRAGAARLLPARGRSSAGRAGPVRPRDGRRALAPASSSPAALPGAAVVRILLRRGRGAAALSSFSTSSGSGSKDGGSGRESTRPKNVHALPFSISPRQALDKFRRWSEAEQGLTWLLRPRRVAIAAVFCPVWSFDVNLRYVLERPPSGQGRRGETVVGWRPRALGAAFGSGPGPVYLPGLSSYAGYAYRRSLVNPVHSTSLVFLGDQTVPFGAWMLRDMDYADERGRRRSLPVTADVWNATKARAFATVRGDLEALAGTELAQEPQQQEQPPPAARLQTQVVSSRRVYLPTYVVTYRVLGAEYEAFVSGCDEGAGVSGESHRVVSGEVASAASAAAASAPGFFSRALGAAGRAAGARGLAAAALQVAAWLASRVLVRLPLIGFLAGTFVGFRKVLQPKYQRYVGSVEWERQRENEAYERLELHADDFADPTGAAQAYFYRHRRRILASLGGENQHQEGSYDWYKEWEEWARQMWQQQQQQQQYSEQQQQRARTTSTSGRAQRSQAPPQFQWDFDPSDPYSVLGIKRGATKAEVSAAFRREIMKYHPDMQARSTEAEKLRASERAKLINEAYRKIKLEMK
jgi:DnaJ-domain-containing protein 1